MGLELQMVVVPVADVDRAKAFYEQAGFTLDVDHAAGSFRVVQFTPPGSACSISFGEGMGFDMPPGVLRGLHLVATDVVAARDDLVARGVDVGEVYHYTKDGQRAPGPDPGHGKFQTYAEFSDPDGNGWVLQEVPG